MNLKLSRRSISYYLRSLVIVILFSYSICINSQNTQIPRKIDSIYIANGIKNIAEYVNSNGWIQFKHELNLSNSNFFKNHKQKFGLGKFDDVVPLRVSRDNLGYSHYRYYQKYKNIKVEYSEVILHEKNGILEKSSGRLIPNIEVITIPNISEHEALQTVENFLRDKFRNQLDYDLDFAVQHSEIVILPQEILDSIHKDLLVYKFEIKIENPLYGADVYIDAHTGDFIIEDLNIKSSVAIGSAITLYSDIVTIVTDYTGYIYRLRDYSRGAEISTYDMNGRPSFFPQFDFTDDDNNWTPADAAYDVHWAVEQAYDYFLNTFGRDSYDNDGAVLNSFVHTNLMLLYGFENNNNALWDGSNRRMVFGDGDGDNYNPWVSVDIVGHEFTHAIVDSTVNFLYWNENGALEESFADIFGTAIDFYARPDDANWLFNDEASITGSSARNLQNPKDDDNDGIDNNGPLPQPDTYLRENWYIGTWDRGGVHVNSGVQNYWFYLISEGGSDFNDNDFEYDIDGIGLTSSAAIAYRMLTVYLTPCSNYKDSRQASIEATDDIFGMCSEEMATVMDAWDAVGVEAPHLRYNLSACGDLRNGTNIIAYYTVTAGNNCSGGTTTVRADSTVIFRAGNSIILNPGFTAELGCTFKASILNCGDGVLKSLPQVDVTYSEIVNENEKKQLLSDKNRLNDYQIYPNPTTGQFSLYSNASEASTCYLEIYNYSGILIYNCLISQIETIIDISNNPSGLYILIIYNDKDIFSQTLIKE